LERLGRLNPEDWSDEATARQQTREMCERLLANPVTEDFEIAEVTRS